MKSCSILVVDDEDELRTIIGRVLEGAGHQVTQARDGNEASKALILQKFDIVITDVIMPDRDGMQVITELRKNYPGVRIVAMSGGGHVPREQYLKIARGLGAHAVLEKPFGNQELLNVVTAVAPKATVG